MTNTEIVVMVVGFSTIAINLILLAFNLKLYTEFFKERVKGK